MSPGDLQLHIFLLILVVLLDRKRLEQCGTFLRLRTHRIDQLFILLIRTAFRKPTLRYLQKRVELITRG
nr:MAG TPA_asm: hypothetical protein [Bacteriophage sp.]